MVITPAGGLRGDIVVLVRVGRLRPVRGLPEEVTQAAPACSEMISFSGVAAPPQLGRRRPGLGMTSIRAGRGPCGRRRGRPASDRRSAAHCLFRKDHVLERPPRKLCQTRARRSVRGSPFGGMAQALTTRTCCPGKERTDRPNRRSLAAHRPLYADHQAPPLLPGGRWRVPTGGPRTGQPLSKMECERSSDVRSSSSRDWLKRAPIASSPTRNAKSAACSSEMGGLSGRTRYCAAKPP